MTFKLLLLVVLLSVARCDPTENKSDGDLDTLEARGKRLTYAVHGRSGYSNKLGIEGDETGGETDDYSGGDGKGAAALAKTATSKNAVSSQATNSPAQKAATARVASAGKQALVSVLQHQLHRAHQLVLAKAEQLKHAQAVAHDAQQVAKEASYQVAVLSSALHNAQANADDAHVAAGDAASEAASQAAMLDRVQHLLSTISEHLSAAQAELEATREAEQAAALSSQHDETVEDDGEAEGDY